MKYLAYLITFTLLPLTAAQCQPGKEAPQALKALEKVEEQVAPSKGEVERLEKTDEEWQAELTQEEFYVLREHGTERAFTGDLLQNKKAGVYTCAGCGLELFHSRHKFKSGTGWPSFWQPIEANHVEGELDGSYGMTRIEVHCARCKGHLGHVFEDGPEPTGLRYCINSVSLDFEEK